MPIRVVFFGSPEFAVPSLRSLASDVRFDVALVVTQPDRPAGRGRRTAEPAVKTAASSLGLAVWQPDTLRSDESLKRLSGLASDLFVVVAYGEVFRRAVLEIPNQGCLNVHPSLLPKYRGSSPIQAAILNGDAVSGVSIIQMVRQLDAGPIVARSEVALIGRETGGELSDRLAAVAAEMLPAVANAWCEGRVVAVPQDDALATFTRELTRADGNINWRRAAEQIERQIRAYSPWPTSWTTRSGHRLVVHAAEVGPELPGSQPGSIIIDYRHILVACGQGTLRLVDVQPEGRKPMPAEAWFRGLRAREPVQFATWEE